MEGFKIGFIAGLLVSVLVLVGFFGMSKLRNGQDYLVTESQNVVSDVILEDDLNSELLEGDLLVDSNDGKQIAPESQNAEMLVEVVTDSTEAFPVVNLSEKDKEIITALEKLITDKVVMDKGSKGTRVGTIQSFLNIYENKTSKIDNDYGDGTKESIRKFQKDQGLTSDGQTGPSTYQKMIDWLKNN